MKFTKMHGIGNDYIYFNGFQEKIEDPNALSIRLSDRHRSIGGDGIVLILPSECADFRMRMFNADGSEGKMCGNASRCIGKYVYEKGLTGKKVITLETLSGIKTLRLDVNDNGVVEAVAVDMGIADFCADHVPVFFNEDEVVNCKLIVAEHEWEITCLSMGNPHCVLFVDEIESLDLPKVGPQFENAPIFPERINTEFVRFVDQTTLEMRVWERGSGETMACGTGACAAVAAAVRTGRCLANVPVTVRLLGGDLQITVYEDWRVEMRGPAAFSLEGEVSV